MIAVSDASFEALRSTVLSAPLDRSRPLWQISLVPRLEDGRVGMIGKIHHALVDGMAALQFVKPDLRRRAVPEPALAAARSRGAPAGAPGRLGWALDAVSRALDDGVGALRDGTTAATHPEATAASVLRRGEARRGGACARKCCHRRRRVRAQRADRRAANARRLPRRPRRAAGGPRRRRHDATTSASPRSPARCARSRCVAASRRRRR